MSNIVANLKTLFLKMRTINLIGIPILIGLFFLVLDMLIYPEYTNSPLENILLPTVFFFFGLSGLPMIIRQEVDFGIFHLDGYLAVVLGVITLLSGLAVALIPVIGMLLQG